MSPDRPSSQANPGPVPDRADVLDDLAITVGLHQRGFSRMLRKCLVRARNENLDFERQVLEELLDQPMHPAYCAGWLRPGMETPLHYCLWLGYPHYDQGMPDQWLGCDPNRVAPLSWSRRASLDDRRQAAIAAGNTDDAHTLWNDFFEGSKLCWMCTAMPGSRTNGQLNNQHTHDPSGQEPDQYATSDMFVRGQDGGLKNINCVCIPR